MVRSLFSDARHRGDHSQYKHRRQAADDRIAAVDQYRLLNSLFAKSTQEKYPDGGFS